MSGTFQYITNNPKQPRAYVEGSFDEEFKDFLKQIGGKWEPENKRWAVPKIAVLIIKERAKLKFDKVYFAESGDYEEI